MIGSAGRFGRDGGRMFFDEEREPTIWTALAYLVILIFAGGCFYLFLLGVSGEFGEPMAERKPWEVSSARRDQVASSGFGYWERRAERREGRRAR
jgi:hypothetical protein